jgi:bacterial/archaeal transporter family-2 protein
MSPLAILLPLLALFAGFLFPFQATINSLLGRGIGGPVAATMISFAVGLAIIAAANFIAFRQIPSLADIARQPPYLLFCGGTIGAVFVGASVFLAPRIGAGALLAFLVAGQLLGAMVIDRFGLFGLVVRELSVGRLVGAALVLAGALVVHLG